MQTEEYNPFDEFTPFSFEVNFDEKSLGMPEYDPDSSGVGFYDEPGKMGNTFKDNGAMELEDITDKSVDFETKFKPLIQKMKENPDLANFESFLKVFAPIFFPPYDF